MLLAVHIREHLCIDNTFILMQADFSDDLELLYSHWVVLSTVLWPSKTNQILIGVGTTFSEGVAGLIAHSLHVLTKREKQNLCIYFIYV